MTISWPKHINNERQLWNRKKHVQLSNIIEREREKEWKQFCTLRSHCQVFRSTVCHCWQRTLFNQQLWLYVCYIDPVRWAVLLLQCTTVNRQRHSRSTVKHVLPVYMGQTNIDLWVPQWIRLRLPSCHPGFDPKHTNYTFIINSHICAIFVVWIERNKQIEAGFDRFKKIINIDSSTAVSI